MNVRASSAVAVARAAQGTARAKKNLTGAVANLQPQKQNLSTKALLSQHFSAAGAATEGTLDMDANKRARWMSGYSGQRHAEFNGGGRGGRMWGPRGGGPFRGANKGETERDGANADEIDDGGSWSDQAGSRDFSAPASEDYLRQTIRSLRGQSYGAYKRLLDSSYTLGNHYHLQFRYVQGDPFAPPSALRVRIPLSKSGFPEQLVSSQIRRTAVADYLARALNKTFSDFRNPGPREPLVMGRPKGGAFSSLRPSVFVLDRSAVRFTESGGSQGEVHLEANFYLTLPARGRTILAEECEDLVLSTLPAALNNVLIYAGEKKLVHQNLPAFVNNVEDQESLRKQVAESKDLIAFVGDGSILPRASGDSQLPLNSAVPWKSPESMRVSFDLPNAGKVHGTGIRRGVTLVVGGGFHGKSTLLQALITGVYNKVPGDGRELVVCDPSACTVQSEDGRCIHSVDVSAFIGPLPSSASASAPAPQSAFSKQKAVPKGILSSSSLTTTNASGSTSLAAGIMEALEMDSRLLLLDEDTCATNFLVSDSRVAQLVPHDPISPFSRHVRALVQKRKVSTIMVVGGCGDYLEQADTVLCMDEYHPADVTEKARQVVAASKSDGTHVPAEAMQSSKLDPASTVRAISGFASLGNPGALRAKSATLRRANLGQSFGEWELDSIHTLVEPTQLRLLIDLLPVLARRFGSQGAASVREIAKFVEKEALDSHVSKLEGMHARVRGIDVVRALNRLRCLFFTSLQAAK